jgi:voltage-gated potassium channel
MAGDETDSDVRTRPKGWIGTRITVVLTFGVALLSVVTGIANIGSTTAPLAFVDVIPATVRQTAGFTGTLTGFLMLGSALGLRRGLRSAWYSTVLLLPVTAVQGVVQSSILSVPLILGSAVSLPVVLLNRPRFTRGVLLSTTQLAAGTALVGVQMYGTVGAFALQAEFKGVDTLTDAFYFTIVTASTVGYGDVTAQSQVARLFAMSVVVLGTASFAVALGALLGPAIEARFARVLGQMTDSELELLEEHVLVLGYGDLTEPILSELEEKALEFVVVTPDDDKASELTERGYSVVVADPSDEEPLQRARIDDARAVVVATHDDAQDALAILTARELRPDVRIVVAAAERENVEKLRRAGADTVISPAVIGGHLLVESALGAEDTEAVARELVSSDDDRPRRRGADTAADGGDPEG